MIEIVYLTQQSEGLRKFMYELMVFLSGLLLSANGQFNVTDYQIRSDKITDPVRIVQISDLHLREFGTDNADLIAAVRDKGPDLIAVTGDMVNNWSPEYEPVIDLCRELLKIAPVYYVLGNHEVDQIRAYNTPIREALRETGVILLDNESVTAVVRGNTIEIGGLTDTPKSYKQSGKDFISRYTQSDHFKLLLVHDPAYYDVGYRHGKRAYLHGEDIDAALCGHRHGGIFRLPLAGAVYAKGTGVFPDLVDSVTKVKNTDVIVSRGLGDSKRFPRFNNPPELVVVDILGK